MEAKLNDGSLNYPVESGLVKLASLIRDSNYDEAEKVQVGSCLTAAQLTFG